MKRNTQQGFTLIELVMVIVILGILAAVAAPKFMNLSSNARVASLQGLSGAIKSAVTMTQSAYIAAGNTSSSTATTVTIVIGGASTAVNVVAGKGFPEAAATGLEKVVDLADYTVAYASGAATITLKSAASGAASTTDKCEATYTQATGLVALVITGC